MNLSSQGALYFLALIYRKEKSISRPNLKIQLNQEDKVHEFICISGKGLLGCGLGSEDYPNESIYIILLDISITALKAESPVIFLAINIK